MKQLTFEELIIIFNDEDYTLKSVDNATEGILIFKKYVKYIIHVANHDVIYGPSCNDVLNAGLTREDAKELRHLNWMIEDESYFACFV